MKIYPAPPKQIEPGCMWVWSGAKWTFRAQPDGIAPCTSIKIHQVGDKVHVPTLPTEPECMRRSGTEFAVIACDSEDYLRTFHWARIPVVRDETTWEILSIGAENNKKPFSANPPQVLPVASSPSLKDAQNAVPPRSLLPSTFTVAAAPNKRSTVNKEKKDLLKISLRTNECGMRIYDIETYGEVAEIPMSKSAAESARARVRYALSNPKDAAHCKPLNPKMLPSNCIAVLRLNGDAGLLKGRGTQLWPYNNLMSVLRRYRINVKHQRALKDASLSSSTTGNKRKRTSSSSSAKAVSRLKKWYPTATASTSTSPPEQQVAVMAAEEHSNTATTPPSAEAAIPFFNAKSNIEIL